MGHGSKASPAGGNPGDALTQADKFRDLARQLECDEDEGRFEDAVRKIATAPKPESDDKSDDA